jgi:hypothetical protein
MKFDTGDNVVVTGGSGADTFDFTSGFTARDTVAGGDGSDTLRVDGGASAVTSTILANVSGVETVVLQASADTATFNASSVSSDISTVKLSGGDNTITVTGGTAGDDADQTVTFSVNETSITTATVTLTGASAVDIDEVGAAMVTAFNASTVASTHTASYDTGTDTLTIRSDTGGVTIGSATASGVMTFTNNNLFNAAVSNLGSQTIDIQQGDNVTLTLADPSGSADTKY